MLYAKDFALTQAECLVRAADFAQALDESQKCRLLLIQSIEYHHAAVVGIVGTRHTGFITVVDERHTGLREENHPGCHDAIVGIPIARRRVVAPFAGVLAGSNRNGASDVVVAHERAHQIGFEVGFIAALTLVNGIIQTIARQHIADFVVKREIELRMEQIVADIFVEQIHVAGERLAHHVEHDAGVFKQLIDGIAQIPDELNVHVLDGIDAESVDVGLFDEPDGMLDHQIADIIVIIVDIGQIL